MHYAKHIDTLNRVKKTIETDTPQMFQKLPETKYIGEGPKRNRNETIHYLSENMTLARLLQK